jgi:primosomal protein N' (replication factor Y)
MFYYEVLVGSASFHGSGALTYASEDTLGVGQLVKVPLRGGTALGVISRVVDKPSFNAKPLQEAFSLPSLPTECLQLLEWLKVYYPAPLGVITQQFLPKSLSVKLAITPGIGKTTSQPNASLPSLTTEQKNVLTTLKKPGSFLLHGETGSGKTRVYLELAQQTVSKGKSVIILTPEISLTPQLVGFFQAHIATGVVVLHSQLTDAERRRNWLEILNASGALVIIGARSALFAPLKNLGLIVIDEAHETAYKQEQAPHYQTQRVASQLAHIHGATLVLGSATPSVADYYVATAKHIPILRMTQLARQTDTTPVEVDTVDLKDRSQFTRTAHLSNKLLQAVQEALDRGEQSLLFLNRRGTARVTICQNCGWQALCPNCDLPLTYHGDSHQLRCHVCGYQESTPSNCPVCSSSDILFKSIGTKAIVQEVERVFPQAKIQRFDTDNTKAEQFNQHFETVKAGAIDILIGTQTLAKGLDLPRLSVVGVILADTGLYLPDYTANERTYQLLYQVIGRIGRGHTKGHAVIQTYESENPIIQAALARDWLSFYDTELAERQQFLYPPFCFLLKLTCRRVQSSAAQTATEAFIAKLRNLNLKVQIIGPSPAFHEKVGGKFVWQVVVKSKARTELLKIIAELPSGWSYDIDPIDLL